MMLHNWAAEVGKVQKSAGEVALSIQQLRIQRSFMCSLIGSVSMAKEGHWSLSAESSCHGNLTVYQGSRLKSLLMFLPRTSSESLSLSHTHKHTHTQYANHND